MKKFKHISERERYIIEFMLKEKRTIREISEKLGRTQWAIRKEIKRGQVTLLNSDLTESTVYLADVGERVTKYNQSNKGTGLKIGNNQELADFIENKIIHEKWSGQAVSLYLQKHPNLFGCTLCTSTIYNYINMGIFKHRKTELKKTTRKKNKKEKRIARNNAKSKSIETRPKQISKREEFGNWEMDTVVSGHGDKTALLVLTERMTRQEITRKIAGKTKECVVEALDKLEKQFGKENFRNIFQTITCDNGCEFFDIDGIEKGNRTQVYFCHAFASGERGSNENANRLVRKHIPKGEHIGNYTDEYIHDMQEWINNYPRKLFNGLSAKEYAIQNHLPVI